MRKLKILCVALIMLSLCFVLAGCGGSNSICGRWKGSSIIYDGKEYSLSYLNEHHDEVADYMFGRVFALDKVELILTQSGNATFTNLDGNTVDGCYTLQDDVLELYRPEKKTDNALMEYDGKSIRFTESGITFILTK